MNRSWLPVRVACAVLALGSTAQAGEHTRLVVTRQQSAAECPDEQALRDAVGARLGYEPFAPDAPSLVVVAFRREGATLLATVQMQDAAGAVKGERTLASKHGDCEELASTTALTISILLDPRSAAAPPPALAPVSVPGAEPSAPPAAAPAGETARGVPPGAPPPIAPSSPSVPPVQRVADSFVVSLFPVALGPIQAFSAGGHAFGLRFGLGALVDLGPRWSLRFPLVVAAATGNAHASYAELDLIPGVLYRFRDRASAGFTPYVGMALKLGGFGAGRALLGKPLDAGSGISAAALFDESSYLDDPNFESTLTVGAEAELGGSWRVSRSFSLDLELSAAVVPVAGVMVEVLAETAAARFSL